MKKAVNATTALALVLAASVTYNIVQHQRAKGIRPDNPDQESNQTQNTAGANATASATQAVTASKTASSGSSLDARKSAITFHSVRYDRDSDELMIHLNSPSSLYGSLPNDAVEFTPAVPNATLSFYGSAIRVDGGFKSGVQYRVRVKKGLTDRSGKGTLENDIVFDFTVPDLTEKLSFLTEGSVFPITAKTVEFPFSTRNIKKFDVRLYRAFDNNLNNMSASNRYYSYYDGEPDTSKMFLVGEKTVTLSDPRNETVNHLLEISDILAVNDPDTSRRYDITPGYYVLEVSYDRKSDWGDYSYRENRTRSFMLTDFALVAASVSDPAGGIVLFARRISDGSAVSDAEIELTSDKNQHGRGHVLGRADAAKRRLVDKGLFVGRREMRVHIGINETRLDAVDGDARGPEFFGQRLRQAPHARFGGGIGDLTRRADFAPHGADIDDAPRFGGDHGGDGRAAQIKNARQIDVDHAPPFLVGHILQKPRVGHAGAVDQHVRRAAECFGSGFISRPHRVWVRDVTAQGKCARLAGYGQSRRLVCTVKERHRVAVSRKAPHHGRADAPAAAGDQHPSHAVAPFLIYLP